MRLNVEEMSFLTTFVTTFTATSREEAVQRIISRLPYLSDKELETIAEHTILKLDRMSDDEFSALVFDDYGEV